MKRFIFILLMIAVVCSVFSTNSILAYAEGEDNSYNEDVKAGAELAEVFNQVKDKVWGIVEQVWDFIMSNETYKNVATAILAVLAFIFLPIILGVVVLVYMILAVIAIIVDIYIWLFELLFGFSFIE